jgi:hypothetical protein
MTMEAKRSRDKNGEPELDAQADLDLRLKDFASRVIRRGYTGLQCHISIPSQTLCAYLDRAEIAQSSIKQGKKNPFRSNMKKRKRATTPPEELMPEHEAKFQKEEKAYKRTIRDDSNYSASLSESDSNSS